MALKIEKVVAALPPVLEPNAVYLVRTGAGFEIRVVDSTGTTAHTLNGGGGTVEFADIAGTPYDNPSLGLELGQHGGDIAAHEVRILDLEAAGGGGSPGGGNGQLQFNNGGAFAGATQVEVDANGNLIFLDQTAKPAAPAEGLQVSTRVRAGGLWLDVQDPIGRHFTLQEHIGLHRIKTWSPSSGTTVVASGMPRTAVGTASHPALSSSAPHPKNSAYRWRMTSAAIASPPSACDERAAAAIIWRGNAAGLGGFKYVNCFALQTLQSTSVAFFGLSATVAAFSTSLALSSLTNCIGIGFTNGTHTNWQVVMNDGAGAPTLIDMGASFPINTTDLLTLMLYADPNGAFIGLRVVNEASGAVYEQTFTTDIPANTTFLSPRNYLNNGGAAAAVIYDCCSVYIGADY